MAGRLPCVVTELQFRLKRQAEHYVHVEEQPDPTLILSLSSIPKPKPADTNSPFYATARICRGKSGRAGE